MPFDSGSLGGLDDLCADCTGERSEWFTQAGLTDGSFPVPYQRVGHGFEVTLDELPHPSYEIIRSTSRKQTGGGESGMRCRHHQHWKWPVNTVYVRQPAGSKR